MEYTIIKAKKDLYNGGLCFTKNKEYKVNVPITNLASLINLTVVNNLGQRHCVGMWYKHFKNIINFS